jgi:type II secretory pathway component PulF
MNAPTGGRAAATALADFIILNEEIAAIVRARLPLEPHLARLGKELPGKAGPLAERIAQRMERGESLAGAMDAECDSLPAAYCAAITAGVQSGQLGAAVESLVESAARVDHLRRVTGVAILYPLILIVVACLLLALVISRVMPTFQWLNAHQFDTILWLTDSPATVPLLAVVVPCVVVLGGMLWWWRSGRLKGAHASAFGPLAWLPGARRVRDWSQAASFAELLTLLVERGVPLDRALRLAGNATADVELQSAAARLADLVQHGAVGRSGDGADAIATARREFPPLIRLALYHMGDRALLAGGLRQAAAVYQDRAVRAGEWYAEYIPILLTLLIGGVLTAGFTLLVIWPYASALNELARWNWR